MATLRRAAKRVNFRSQNHIYQVQNREIPSVTTIIKAQSDVYGEYRHIDPEILNKAADRGNAVHEAVERSIKEGGKAWTDYKSASPYVDGYNKFMELGVMVPICPELKLFHPDLWYAGTIDIVCLVNGEVAVADVKTTSKLNKEAVRLQLAGYAMMVEWWTGINPKRYVLHLRRNSGRNFDRISDRFDRDFIEMVELYNRRLT